jgi:cell wall-associated NlpC family hydrolase
MVTALLLCLGVVISAVSPARAESVDSKRAEAREIAERLSDLEDEQMQLGATYERANYERHLAEQKVAEAQAQADAASEEMAARQAELRRFAVTAYQGGTEAPGVAALLTDEASSGTVKRFYIETTTGDRGDLIDALHAAQRSAEEDVERLDAAKDEADSYVAEIARARDAAASATEKQNALHARVQGELATLVAEEAAAVAARNPSRPSTVAAPSAAASSASTPAPIRPAPTPARPPAPAPVPATPPPSPDGSKASGAISAALSKVGAPYVWGAAGPSAFDCSGLVAWAYAQVGVSLPHYSGAQYSMTTRISAGQLQPGDLVFWGPGGSEHVALYMGGNQLVHAFSSAGRTQVTALAGWWKPPSGYGRLHY